MIGSKLASLLCVAGALLGLGPSAAAQELVSVELQTEVRPSADPMVGQRTSIYVTVLMSERPERSPRFTLPEVDGALFRQAPGSPLLGTELRAGHSYNSQRYELLLFPQRAGTLVVPAIEVQVELSTESTRAATQPLHITAHLPKGVAPGTVLLTTARLDVTQSWEPPLDETGEPLTVGAALRRTITIRAGDVLGVAIPPAPVASPDGLAVYPGDPVTEDKLQRGVLSSSRTDVVTYICTTPGSIELPALLYRWWNPERGVLEQRDLPGISFEVLAARTGTPGRGDAAPGFATAATRPVVWGIALLIAVGASSLFLARKRLRGQWATLMRAREASEGACFRRLARACRAGAASHCWSTLAAWLGHPDLGQPPRALGQSAIVRAAPDLAREVDVLQRALLAADEPWSGEPLLAALREVRRCSRPHRRRIGRALPPLNPTAD